MVRFGHRWVAVRSIRAPRAAEPLNCPVPAIAFPKVFGRIPPNVGNKLEKASSRDGQQANHNQRRLAKRNLRSAKSPRFIPPYPAEAADACDELLPICIPIEHVHDALLCVARRRCGLPAHIVT